MDPGEMKFIDISIAQGKDNSIALADETAFWSRENESPLWP